MRFECRTIRLFGINLLTFFKIDISILQLKFPFRAYFSKNESLILCMNIPRFVYISNSINYSRPFHF